MGSAFSHCGSDAADDLLSAALRRPKVWKFSSNSCCFLKSPDFANSNSSFVKSLFLQSFDGNFNFESS